MDIKLYEPTLALMRSTDVPVNVICRDLGLSKRWWSNVMAGNIKDPGVRRMERLYAYLARSADRGGDSGPTDTGRAHELRRSA
jgi:hypothetical protein